jgi:outer membrane protein assembly factor BamC
MKRFIVLAGAAMTLASMVVGCGLTETINERGRIDYKSAKRADRDQLEVPPDLVKPGQEDRFSVPDRARNRTATGFEQSRTTASTVPAEQRVLPTMQGVRLERSGTQRWLVVDTPAERLWPVLREFWQEQGFVVDSEVAEAGIMETGWAENRAKVPQGFIRNSLGRVFDSLYSTGERDRFRVRLERNGGQTEVFLSHRGLTEVLNQTRDSTVWTPRPNDPELEVEYLRRLMVKLGADQQRSVAAVQQLNQPAAGSTSNRAAIQQANGLSRIEVQEGFDRAWRRVGLALERGGFTVEDRDRSAGVYFVRYVDPEVESRSSGKPGVLDRVLGRQAKPVSALQYRVRVVAPSASLSTVDVLDKDGKALANENDRQTARKIVGLLHEQLK